MNFSEICKNFAPGWYAVPMGTGALAISTLPMFPALAQVLHWLNTLLFFLILVPWLTKWIIFREQSLSVLKHPVQAHFYPMFSIACLVLAGQWLSIEKNIAVASAFWIVGAVAALLFSFLVLTVVFRGEHTSLEHVTPSMYIPVVGMVVIPVAGARLAGLAAEANSPLQDPILLLNIVGLGAGLFMYLSLLALTLHRKFLHKPIQGPLSPTIWIQLAPLGILPISLHGLATQMPGFATMQPFVDFMALLVWGFGLWWYALAAVQTYQGIRHKEIPFALSWWAFVFPQGAFVLATQQFGHLAGIAALSFPLWTVLAATWLVVLFKTLEGLKSLALLK